MRPSLASLPLHPLLFAAYAVLFLYAENIQLVRFSEVISPLAWSIGAAVLVLAALTILLRDLHRGALIATALVIGFFGYGHVAGSLGAEAGGWPLFFAWAALLALITGVLLWRRSLHPPLTSGLNVVGLLLVIFSLSTIVPHQLQASGRDGGGAFEPTGLRAQRTTSRDIYYLVFDRYGSASSLAAGFGITDNDLYGWLAERGFSVAGESYANYSRTSLSLTSVLNLDYLDEVAARQPRRSTDYGPVHELLQQHVVGRFLREHGYRYIHIGSWFNPTRAVRVADESLESDSTTEFQAVLGETTALPLLAGLLPDEEQMPPEDEKHVEHARFQFRALHRVIDEPGPKFVLVHVLLPHDPYTFDAEGNYVPVADRQRMTVEEQFRGQLAYTNSEIKRIIERLLARPESERPIIVLQADEGPYPHRYAADELAFDWSQATPAELETKFGILNAYYLPAEPDQPADLPAVSPTMTSVNTFRLVLERYFGVDLPFLPDRVLVSASPRYPYDLTEVTERLPGPVR